MSAIVLSAAGSLGDVLPFVAVGGALRARGHAVRFLLPSEFHPMVRAAGFAVAPSGFEISPATLAALDVDWSRAGGLALMRKALRELVVPALPAAHDAMADAAAGSDLIVGDANQIAARRTEAIGAGIVVPARRRRHVGAALDHILHDRSITERSRTLARALEGTDGASVTADVLETLLA